MIFLSDIEPSGYEWPYCILKFDCHLKVDKATSTDKFKYNKGDYDSLRDFINIDWDNYLDVQKNTVDEMWEKFKLVMVQGMNTFIPKGSKRAGIV